MPVQIIKFMTIEILYMCGSLVLASFALGLGFGLIIKVIKKAFL